VALSASAAHGRQGVRDWLLQRGSAVILGFYTAFVCTFLLLHPELSYAAWRELFAAAWMRFFSSLALLAFVAHAWVGVWIICTDYLTARTLGAWGRPLRWAGLFVVALALFVALGLGLRALWT